jgi:hypothetical protein
MKPALEVRAIIWKLTHVVSTPHLCRAADR